MAKGNPYSRIVQSMRKNGAYENGFNMEIATVIAITPVKIKYNGVEITKNIYCNEHVNSNILLKEILKKEKYISDDLKVYLRDAYDRTKLTVGDKVLVQRVENNFYITGKVANV